MHLFRELLKSPTHVSSQKGLTHAGLPGTVSKQINLTTLEGSEKLHDEEEQDHIGLPEDPAAPVSGTDEENAAIKQ